MAGFRCASTASTQPQTNRKGLAEALMLESDRGAAQNRTAALEIII